MVILGLMKMLKDFVDKRMKGEKNKGKKALYKVIWIVCTGKACIWIVLHR